MGKCKEFECIAIGKLWDNACRRVRDYLDKYNLGRPGDNIFTVLIADAELHRKLLTKEVEEETRKDNYEIPASDKVLKRTKIKLMEADALGRAMARSFSSDLENIYKEEIDKKLFEACGVPKKLFKDIGTTTGRMSSKKPNLVSNIPREDGFDYQRAAREFEEIRKQSKQYGKPIIFNAEQKPIPIDTETTGLSPYREWGPRPKPLTPEQMRRVNGFFDEPDGPVSKIQDVPEHKPGPTIYCQGPWLDDWE